MKKDTKIKESKIKDKSTTDKPHELFKNHLTKIIIQRGKYKGKERIDIRQWVCLDDVGNKWIPTKAGCNIPVELLEDFKDIVASL